jgi:hypothetical protein
MFGEHRADVDVRGSPPRSVGHIAARRLEVVEGTDVRQVLLDDVGQSLRSVSPAAK